MDGGLSDWFATVLGVLQGCMLSPLLFDIFLEVVMALVLDENDIGADITGHCISNLRFADDISLMAGSIDDLQQLVNKVYTTSDKFRLRVSTQQYKD